eukprot:2142851-Alexandrium_andersonii.AAC.1
MDEADERRLADGLERCQTTSEVKTKLKAMGENALAAAIRFFTPKARENVRIMLALVQPTWKVHSSRAQHKNSAEDNVAWEVHMAQCFEQELASL